MLTLITSKNRHIVKMVISLILFVSVADSVAQSYSISGYISDNKTRETLIGATIFIENSTKGAISDKNGFFNLSGLKPGTYKLLVTYLGYESKTSTVNLIDKGIVLDEIRLEPKALSFEEVSIVAIKPDQAADREIETSYHELTPKMIQSIPTAGSDIFKAVKYLPGIDKTEPYSPLYSVRGGDPGENGVMLDGVMIYNPYHSSISAGIFNVQTIKNVDMLVGGFGAEFGGRNSSYMYITTKDGNTEEVHGEFEPSSFHSKMFVEFPAGKNASMMVAGRYMFDLPFYFIMQNKAYFYDFNLSYTNRLNNKHRITTKYFESKDKTGFNFNTFYKYFGNSIEYFLDEPFDIYDDFHFIQQNDWKNRAVTFIHKGILHPRLYVRNQVYYSSHRSNNLSGIDFNFDFEDEEGREQTLEWQTSNSLKSQIQDICAKSSLEYKMASFNSLKAGVEYNEYNFANDISFNKVDNSSIKVTPSLLALYAENKLSTKYLVLRAGLRAGNFNNKEWLYEPRLNVNFNLPGRIKLKMAYGDYYQYITSMNTTEVEMNQIVDYYYPLMDRKPSKSTHYIVGLEKRIKKTLNTKLDIYFKDIKRIYMFDLNQTDLDVFSFTDNLTQGTGKAYGAEFMVQGNYKNLSGWASYSLSFSTRKYPELFGGTEFDFDYNHKHSVKAVLNYKLTKNYDLNTSFIFLSGMPRSIETMIQSYYNYDALSNTVSSFPMWISNGKNTSRMPATVNLDLGIRRKLLSGFGKQLADIIHADESYVTVTVRNLLFLYRNVDTFIPGMGDEVFKGKYIPLGSNYVPSVGMSYTLKF